MIAPKLVQSEAVPIDQLHALLNETWMKISCDIHDETGHMPLRTATLTLAIITTSATERESVRESIHQLATAIPARVLLFGPTDPTSEIRARVSAQCSFTHRKQHGACYDIIDVDFPSDEYEAIPNIISSQRISQLPTFIFWSGEVDITSERFRRICRPADRLIIDSEQFNDRLKTVCSWAQFLEMHRMSFAGGDLAWTRIGTWRELIAQAFDNPITSGLVPRINRISITFDSSAEASALLLASWLTSRMGCRPQRIQRQPMTTTLSAMNPSTNHTVEVNLDQSQSIGFGLRTVRLQAHGGNRTARVRIRRDEADHSSIRIQTTGMPTWERVVQHLKLPRHELIGTELMCFDRDEIYDQALTDAAEFARMYLDARSDHG